LRLSIPALNIDAPVVPVSLEAQQSGSRRPYQQWSVPDSYAAGWHDSSAPPGLAGNTVLNGHNNIHGAVFGNLVDLAMGEPIILYEADRKYIYKVVHREYLPEQGEPLKARLRNARWIAPSDDMRLTIVTCWPNSSNSHRLVVVAQPLSLEPGF
jgi:sortase A